MTQKHPDRVDESLIALRRILRATELYARDLAQAAGVTPAQLRVLQIVGEKKDPTAKTLANQMGVSQATVTALVDKLVARELVSRQPSAQDRRQTNITLTTKGEDVLEEAPDGSCGLGAGAVGVFVRTGGGDAECGQSGCRAGSGDG